MITNRDNFCAGFAALAEGTNANTFKTTAAISYSIAGRGYTKAATDNLPFSSGHTSLAAQQKCAFFVMLDAAGAVTTEQSTVVPNSQAVGYKAGAWDWPLSATKACIGAIVVDAQNAAVFVPNTTDLGAADVVDTYVNVVLDYSMPVGY